MSSRVAFGKRKHTAKNKLLTAREQKRLEWWSVRSKEGNLKNEDKERKLESENSTDKVEEPKAKKLKLEDETKLQTDSNDRSDTKTTQKKKKKAYILFVGNLPYTVSAEEIREHFSKTGDVKEVRLLTRKGTDDSRGCAYVEFENRTSHMFGLKMNESLLGGRKINVEFTSRGRNTPLRMERLKEKNKRASRFRQPVKEDEE